MKFYTATSTRENGAGDSFDSYTGTDLEKAISAAEDEWNHLTNREKKSTLVEVRVYDLPDDTDLTDEDELINALCDCSGYDTEIEFDFGFSELLREQVNLSNLSQRAFAEKLGVPKRTLENWLGSQRKPNDFTQKSVLKKAEEIVEEIENEE